MKNKRVGILPGIVAGGTFLAFYLAVQLGLIPSLLIALLAFIGTRLIFKPTKQDIEIYESNLSKYQIDKMVREGKQKIGRMKGRAHSITKIEVREDVMEICNLANLIFDDFKKDPKDIKAARKFINYYLDTTEKIILKYIELSNRSHYTDSERETLNKVEIILDQIKETFRLQLNKLVEDDFLDLDTELEVLDMTMKSEGV